MPHAALQPPVRFPIRAWPFAGAGGRPAASAAGAGVRRRYTRSRIVEMPWPRPMHMVARPTDELLCSIVLSSAVVMRAPEQPSG